MLFCWASLRSESWMWIFSSYFCSKILKITFKSTSASDSCIFPFAYQECLKDRWSRRWAGCWLPLNSERLLLLEWTLLAVAAISKFRIKTLVNYPSVLVPLSWTLFWNFYWIWFSKINWLVIFISIRIVNRVFWALAQGH